MFVEFYDTFLLFLMKISAKILKLAGFIKKYCSLFLLTKHHSFPQSKLFYSRSIFGVGIFFPGCKIPVGTSILLFFFFEISLLHNVNDEVGTQNLDIFFVLNYFYYVPSCK
jgi:hypothetical protein